METLYILNENDFKKWVIEAVKDYFNTFSPPNSTSESEEKLITRKEVAKLLKVSLVTLSDWMKRGLPFHKQRGRVYFIESEVLDHIKSNNSSRARLRI